MATEDDPSDQITIAIFRGEDGAAVVQIDTDDNVGRLRVNLNDGYEPLWDGDPEKDSYPVMSTLDLSIDPMMTREQFVRWASEVVRREASFSEQSVIDDEETAPTFRHYLSDLRTILERIDTGEAHPGPYRP